MQRTSKNGKPISLFCKEVIIIFANADYESILRGFPLFVIKQIRSKFFRFAQINRYGFIFSIEIKKKPDDAGLAAVDILFHTTKKHGFRSKTCRAQ